MEKLEKLLAQGEGLKLKLINHKQVYLTPCAFETAGVSASYHDLHGILMDAMQRESKLAAICLELKEALEKIEKTIPIKPPHELGMDLVRVCKITLEALARAEQLAEE